MARNRGFSEENVMSAMMNKFECQKVCTCRNDCSHNTVFDSASA